MRVLSELQKNSRLSPSVFRRIYFSFSSECNRPPRRMLGRRAHHAGTASYFGHML